MKNQDIFITSIHVKKVRNLENFDIPLSEDKRQHLIITGKNGSGKTSLLLELDKFIQETLRIERPSHRSELLTLLQNCYSGISIGINNQNDLETIANFQKQIRDLEQALFRYGDADINFKNSHLITQNYLYVFFESKRINQPTVPSGITKIDLKILPVNSKINTYFIQYIRVYAQ